MSKVSHSPLSEIETAAEMIGRLKVLEDSLHARELELQQARRIARLGTWRWFRDTDSAIWSPEMYELLGIDPSQPPLDYAGLRALHTPESRMRRDKAMQKVLEDGELYEHEMELILADGSHRWIVMRGEAAAFDQEGKVSELRGTLQDITERKQIELALQERERELREAHRINRIGTWTTNVPENIVWWSPEVYRAFGADPSGPPLRPPKLSELFLNEGYGRMQDVFNRAMQAGEPYEIDAEIQALDGTRRWICARGEVSRWGENGEVLELRGTIQDVTSRKRVEIALRERERELSEAHRLTRLGTWHIDAKTREGYWSAEIFAIFGLPPEPRRPPSEVIAPMFVGDGWERVTNAIEQAVTLGKRYEMDVEIVAADGVRRWFTTQGGPARWNKAGEITELRGVIQDITLRKQTEEALRDRERRFRELAESLPQLVWISNNQGGVTYVNQSFEQYAGITLAHIEGGHSFETVHPDDREASRELWKRCIAAGEPYGQEVRLLRHDGAARSFIVRAVPTRNDRGEVERWIGTAFDIHDRKLADEVVRRTEKLAATGRLAASMAHEINNPLSAVTNSLYLALLDPGLGETTRAYLQQAERELARVAAVTTQTLRFHQQSTSPTEVHPGEIMDSAYGLFQTRFFTRGVTVERQYRSKERLFCCDGELRQVFANLLSNALDATPSGGRVRIRIRCAHAPTGEPGIVVTVADTGHGIPKDIQRRIFEPFLSTKAATGTGLGLWVSQGIVQRHKGTIRVRSRIAKPSGTVFSLFFPHNGMQA